MVWLDSSPHCLTPLLCHIPMPAPPLAPHCPSHLLPSILPSPSSLFPFQFTQTQLGPDSGFCGWVSGTWAALLPPAFLPSLPHASLFITMPASHLTIPLYLTCEKHDVCVPVPSLPHTTHTHTLYFFPFTLSLL